MTRMEAEAIAAKRNKGCERGVSYYACQVPNWPEIWYVIQNDNGVERIV